MRIFEYDSECCDVENVMDFLLRKGAEGWEAFYMERGERTGVVVSAPLPNESATATSNFFTPYIPPGQPIIQTYKVFFKREKE